MYTTDELISVCISRQIEDGEFVAQGIATPLVAAGYMLARLTHAPNVVFISAIGQSLVRDWGPLGVATIETLWNERGYYSLDFIQAACDILPRFGPKEFFRPGQVDAYGNFNNVYMGGTYDRPRLRLPGAGGIPDVTVHEEHICLYVPRHGRHTFVEQLDFRSGLGHHPARTHGRARAISSPTWGSSTLAAKTAECTCSPSTLASLSAASRPKPASPWRFPTRYPKPSRRRPKNFACYAN